MSRRWLLAVAFLLSGCASIPLTGPVRVVGGNDVGTAQDQVRVIVRHPVEGMTVEQIVQGFLSANASADSSFAIAREYLTNDLASSWDTKAVTLYDPTRVQITQIDNDTVRISVGVIGRLAVTGRLTLLEAISQRTFELNLTQTDQGWRISRLPTEPLLTLADFTRSFLASNLWFLNAEYTRLVPDAVWVVNDQSRATRLTTLLLAGPAGPLAQSVRTAIPADTELDIAAVPLVDAVGQVSLTAPALQAVDSQRYAMLAQFVYTLSPISSRVAVQAGGQQLRASGLSALTAADFAALDPDQSPITRPLFYVQDGYLWRLGGAKSRQLWRTGSPTNIAVSRDGLFVADTVGNRLEIRSIVDGSVQSTARSSVQDLDFDATGRLWIATVRGTLQMLGADGALRTVPGILPGEQVVAVASSPDGARLAVVSATGRGLQLRVFPISTVTGTVSLGEPIRVERDFADVLDVDWASSTQLVVAARLAVEQAQVYLVDLAGVKPRLVPGISNVQQIVAAPTEPICATTADGTAACLDGGSWTDLSASSLLAYAG